MFYELKRIAIHSVRIQQWIEQVVQLEISNDGFLFKRLLVYSYLHVLQKSKMSLCDFSTNICNWHFPMKLHLFESNWPVALRSNCLAILETMLMLLFAESSSSCFWSCSFLRSLDPIMSLFETGSFADHSSSAHLQWQIKLWFSHRLKLVKLIQNDSVWNIFVDSAKAVWIYTSNILMVG